MTQDLPSDLIKFLQSGESLEISMCDGEVQSAELRSIDELKASYFRIESDVYDDEGLFENSEIKGYSLIKSADGYDPDGVLVWFPDLEEYGAWDCDHHSIITFPSATWSQIITDPTWYINGQWYPDRIEHRKITPENFG